MVRYGLVEPGSQITLSQGARIGRPSTLYAVAHGSASEITSIGMGRGVCLIGGGELVLPDIGTSSVEPDRLISSENPS